MHNAFKMIVESTCKCYNMRVNQGGIFIMAKRTVKDLDVAGKRVIVRVDFNVPRKDGVITNDNRIVAALPTINYLVENKAKVIMVDSKKDKKAKEKLILKFT